MELSEVMSKRRSIRAYDSTRTIEKEQLEKLISAAILAPTWKNSQTARYYVVTSPEMKKAVMECMPEFNQARCQDASAVIVTTFVKTRSGFTREGVAENELGEGWGCYDLGLATENLLLQATEMGFGTLVMGIRDGEKLAKALNVPETQQVVSVISVGYPAEEPAMPKRKTPEDVAVFL